MKKLLFILPLLAMILVGCGRYSEGERSGVLVKLSQRGLVAKTYEGTLNIGTGGASITWDFTSDNQEVTKKLQENIGKEVTVKYRQEFIVAPWRGDTKYFVEEVK